MAKVGRKPHGAEEFWAHIEIGNEDTCWPWTGKTERSGYARAYYGAHRYGAHRLAWELTNGPIPDGLCACHQCDNPKCCNPNHLFLGTHQDNMDDMMAKGRSGKGDKSARARHPEKTARGLCNGVHTHPERRPYGLRNGRYTKPDRTARGEQSGSAVLSEEKVVAIRELYQPGKYGYHRLAQQFGVSRRTIKLIVQGKTWTHIPFATTPAR